MIKSESIKAIMPALVKAQASIKHAVKDAKNPHFKNQYATLESVIDATKDALLANKITVIQSVTKENTLLTELVHESGEYISAEMPLLLNKQDMQQMGSAITYARRYQLSAMLNMAQTDDDGNDAAKTQQTSPLPEQNPVDYLWAHSSMLLQEKPGDVEIEVGKKVLGKKISEVEPGTLDEMIDYFFKLNGNGQRSIKTNKFLINAYQHLINVGYLPPRKEK